ncbi:hypothetical protein B0H11DRAFT_2205105 [Mycena galericulata]|nr:hypothetical protein B0H11DRAFT_2205105 [Mycena galericulata]
MLLASAMARLFFSCLLSLSVLRAAHAIILPADVLARQMNSFDLWGLLGAKWVFSMTQNVIMGIGPGSIVSLGNEHGTVIELLRKPEGGKGHAELWLLDGWSSKPNGGQMVGKTFALGQGNEEIKNTNQCIPGRIVADGDGLGKQWIIIPHINGEHPQQSRRVAEAAKAGHAQCMAVLQDMRTIYMDEILKIYEFCKLVYYDIKNDNVIFTDDATKAVVIDMDNMWTEAALLFSGKFKSVKDFVETRVNEAIPDALCPK